MAQTTVMPCDCTTATDIPAKCAGKKEKQYATQTWMNQNNGAAFQDAQYGKGRRVHNVSGKKDGAGPRCTVCKKTK